MVRWVAVLFMAGMLIAVSACSSSSSSMPEPKPLPGSNRIPTAAKNREGKPPQDKKP